MLTSFAVLHAGLLREEFIEAGKRFPDFQIYRTVDHDKASCWARGTVTSEDATILFRKLAAKAAGLLVEAGVVAEPEEPSRCWLEFLFRQGAMGSAGEWCRPSDRRNMHLRGELLKGGPFEASADLLGDIFSEDQVTDAPTEAVYLGEGRVRVGKETVVLVRRERAVIEALVKLGAADQKTLVKKSRYREAVRVLRDVRRKYPALTPHIIMPRMKCSGGYRTTIRPYST